jgi:hypothetical protein
MLNPDVSNMTDEREPRTIGGFFGLELRRGSHYHAAALKLNTGRNCLEHILRAKGYLKVFIPFYACDAILEPFKKLNIEYEFYSLDETLNPILETHLKSNEALLYINYFGLKQTTVERLAKQFGPHLIIDNSQAFFATRIDGLDTFYSARKFFGVADGAYLYTDTILRERLERDTSFGRMSHLLRRLDCSAESAYEDFQRHEKSLSGRPIMYMSTLTNAILASIDYENIKGARRRNFQFLEKHLSEKNLLSLQMFDQVPMVYPFKTNDATLRRRLIDNRIYVATYWPGLLNRSNTGAAEDLAREILPLPIDHRYDEDHLLAMIRIIA